MTKLYLALKNISKKWTMPIRDWKAVLNRFTIQFDEPSGAGAASPHMTCTVVSSPLGRWHWCITGGVCLYVWRIQRLGARPLPADLG